MAGDNRTTAFSREARRERQLETGAGGGARTLEETAESRSESRVEYLRRRLRSLLSLYVIVNASTPLDLVEQLLEVGVGAIQLREKRLPPQEQVPVARRLQALCAKKGALFVVNDFVDVALASGADGVHVGQGDEAAASARRRLGPDRILGVSTGSPEEAVKAAADGADYVGVGPIYPTKSKETRPPAGPSLVARVRAVTTLPIVGIAGIGPGRAAPVVAAGADGVAVISAVLDAPDPVEAATVLLAEVRRV